MMLLDDKEGTDDNVIDGDFSSKSATKVSILDERSVLK